MKYAHLSSPEVSNDAYDLIGPYQEVELGRFQVEAGALWNATPNHGWYVQGEIKYRWKDE